MASPDLIVVASRCQPVHAGHRQALAAALESAPRVLLLCLGADEPPSPRTPWPTSARMSALDDLAGDDERVQVDIEWAGGHDERRTESVSDALRDALGVRLEVRLCEPGSTAADTGIETRQKPRRLIDER